MIGVSYCLASATTKLQDKSTGPSSICGFGLAKFLGQQSDDSPNNQGRLGPHLFASLASTESISKPLLEYIPRIWLSCSDDGSGPIGGAMIELFRAGRVMFC